MQVSIGTSGWQYIHWRSRFYPQDIPKTHWLAYFSEHFDTVESNSSFYRIPSKNSILRWRAQVSANFVFASKLFRVFTHVRRLKLSSKDLRLLKVYMENVSWFEKNLGPILIQLPPSLKYDLETLAGFTKNLWKFKNLLPRGRQRFALEFRHGSWLVPDTFRFLKKQKIAYAISDADRWPTKLIKTADWIYVRLHGRPNLFASKYTPVQLRQWAQKIKKLKAKRSYVYFNNDYRAYAVQNARYLRDLLV